MPITRLLLQLQHHVFAKCHKFVAMALLEVCSTSNNTKGNSTPKWEERKCEKQNEKWREPLTDFFNGKKERERK